MPVENLRWALTAVKRKSMRNALVPGRRPRKFPAQISLKPLQNRCYAKKNWMTDEFAKVKRSTANGMFSF